MQLRIIAIGRIKQGPEIRLIDEYRKRLRWPLSIQELEPKSLRGANSRMASEAALIRAALAKRKSGKQDIVALDEAGVAWSSRQFADKLAGWRDQAVAEVIFVIGGADGLDPDLLSSADIRLSLGAMTWPHALARVLLVEQIYRAQQIILGHPYHRD